MPIPSWLNVGPADFLRAREAGTQAGLEQQRIAQQGQQFQQQLDHQKMIAQMQADARKQITQQNAQMRQAQIEFQKQYHDAQVGLAQDRIQEMQAVQQAKSQEAAQQFAARQKFAALLKQGVPQEQALYQVPELATPSNVAAITRTGTNKDYGDIETEEVQPGIMAAFRRGSPGFHVLPGASTKMSNEQKVIDDNLKQEYRSLQKRLTGYDPKSDASVQAQMQQIEQMRRANARGEQIPQGGPASTSPFKEGQTIRNKKDGKMYVIKNGQPVPVDQSGAQGQDETVVPEQ